MFLAQEAAVALDQNLVAARNQNHAVAQSLVAARNLAVAARVEVVRFQY